MEKQLINQCFAGQSGQIIVRDEINKQTWHPCTKVGKNVSE
jgi:hypothetical protein